MSQEAVSERPFDLEYFHLLEQSGMALVSPATPTGLVFKPLSPPRLHQSSAERITRASLQPHEPVLLSGLHRNMTVETSATLSLLLLLISMVSLLLINKHLTSK